MTAAEIGSVIRQLRLERKLTQTDLGEKLGVTKGTVASYEAGRNNFTIDTLQRLSNALGVSLFIEIKPLR